MSSPTPPFQPAILKAIPSLAMFLVFDLEPETDPAPALARLRDGLSPDDTVVGVGEPLAVTLRARVAGLRTFPSVSGARCSFPSTQGALWAFVAGTDAGDIHDRAHAFRALLGDGFALREEVPAFRYRGGRDLSGYEDGTESPKGDKAVAAAIIQGKGSGLDGGSFVAVQKFTHDLERFGRMSPGERDLVIGRRLGDNEEIADAPASAHVKRAAQESYDPPAFIVRQSMPWGGLSARGLYFVAYGESLDRFERILRRMAGQEDGVVDGLMTFTRALTGGYYFCPPTKGGKLDWSALGL